MQLHKSTLENIRDVQGQAMKIIRGMEEGFRNQEYFTYVRDEHTRLDKIKL